MKKLAHLEYWLRGPVSGIPALLQPAAHALLQAREEVNLLMDGFAPEKLWARPAGVAAVGFHLRHLTGVLDRLLTYARGEALDPGQLNYLAGEEAPGEDSVEERHLGQLLVTVRVLSSSGGVPDAESRGAQDQIRQPL